MEIPNIVISDICTKLREVLHTLESYSDSEPKGELESEIKPSSSQVSYALWYLLNELKKSNTNLPSDILHTEQSET